MCTAVNSIKTCQQYPLQQIIFCGNAEQATGNCYGKVLHTSVLNRTFHVTRYLAVYGWIDGWMDGWIDGRFGGWVDFRMSGWVAR